MDRIDPDAFRTQGDYPRREDDREASFTDTAREAARTYRKRIEESSDPFVSVVRGVGSNLGDAADNVFDWLTRRARGGGPRDRAPSPSDEPEERRDADEVPPTTSDHTRSRQLRNSSRSRSGVTPADAEAALRREWDPWWVSSPVSFAELGLRAELQRALEALGYEEPTPIQREAVPWLVTGRDLVGQAATGTGKTAAFALPILQRLDGAGRAPRAVVLVPTRELAIQVAEAIHRYGRGLGTRVLPIYGGQPIGRQFRALESGVDVVVGTPGRVLDHLGRGTLVVSAVSTVVLDEADEMLDMGFAEDIEAILEQLPAQRQTVLFSATLPARINGLVKRFLTDPVKVRIHRESSPGEANRVRQVAYVVPRAHKASALGRVLDMESPDATVVFCRTRDQVDSLGQTLVARGYRAESLHGGMTQEQRDQVMQRVRSGAAELLVATDVAARGLDIEHLTHVVNFDLPSSPDAYVHRVGRVGRAGRQGVAITLVEPRQHRLLKMIEKQTRQTISIETLPTVADLRARRLELTRAALQEALAEDDYEQFRVVVDSFDDEYDIMQIALAAVKLAHESDTVESDLEEIPEVLADRRGRTEQRRGRKGREADGEGGDTARVFIGLGHAARIRPQDLVGAIANETSLSGRQIGAIEITHNFSVVEVPEAAVREVIAALQASTIKGRKPRVKRYRPPRT